MARQTNRLSARAVSSLKAPGLHADGGGLYLAVSPNGAKRWLFIFHMGGKRYEMGLGGLAAVGLADARELATEARRQVAAGTNPIEARRASVRERERQVVTFGSFADAVVADLSPQFRNSKHLAQWTMTLRDYAAPLRAKRLHEIETSDILAVLKPIWLEKPETASRLRGRIERVLDAAKAKGLRSGENPARWRGHLAMLLPKRPRLTRGHHAAMPYTDVPAFMERLHKSQGMGALALEFLILTVGRTGEVIGARWSEIDVDGALWTVPANRMKAGREHRVPLVPRAVEILKELRETATGPYVFPGNAPKAPISSATMTKALRTAKGAGTVHGFRSAFRDWSGEETNFSEAVAEAALAHVVGDQTERAYRRGDALAKRRKLMEAWARYSTARTAGKPNNVIPFEEEKRAS